MADVMTVMSVVLLMAVAAVLAVFADRWLVRPTVRQIQPLVSVPQRPIAPLPLVATTTPRPARDLVTLHLVSATGRPLGTTTIDRKARRPTFRFQPLRAREMQTFVAVKPMDGGFVYRQVGTERE